MELPPVRDALASALLISLDFEPMPRRVLQPLDITLRYGRRYQWVRRLFLAFSVSLTVLLPMWHLHASDIAGSGLAGDTAWASLSAGLPDTAPPIAGAPTSITFFGIELLDPAMALGVAVARGIDWNWLWAVIPGLLLVVLLGRFFCGWACPYLPILAASNAARWFLTKLGVPIKDVKVPRVTSRVVLIGVLIATALTGVQVMPLVYPPALIGRAVFHAVFFGSLGVGVLLITAAFLFDTFVSRAGFCRSLCPGGAMFSIIGGASVISVKREVAKCTDCTVCDVVCNLGQLPMTDKLDNGCERCGKCIASCPTKALSWGVGKPAMLRKPSERP